MDIRKYSVKVLAQGKLEKVKLFERSVKGTGVFDEVTCCSLPDDVNVGDLVLLTHKTQISNTEYQDTRSTIRYGVVTKVSEARIETIEHLYSFNHMIMKVLGPASDIGIDRTSIPNLQG